MKYPYKRRSPYTKFADWVDRVAKMFDNTGKISSKKYPYEKSIETRWGNEQTIFAPLEREIYRQFFLIDAQERHQNWQITNITTTVDTTHYQRLMKFLSENFQYQNENNFDKQKLIDLVNKKILSLECYNSIRMSVSPQIQWVIHQDNDKHAHLLKNKQIHIHNTKVILQSFGFQNEQNINTNHNADDDNHNNNDIHNTHTSSDGFIEIKGTHYDNSNDNNEIRMVQIRIYDEEGLSIPSIKNFPCIIGKQGEVQLKGYYSSGKNIRLDFNDKGELVIENISTTNWIFVNNKKLDKQENNIIQSCVVQKGDRIYIGKITNDMEENKLFPRLEIANIQVRRKTPEYRGDNNTPPARRSKPTPQASEPHSLPLFNIVAVIGDQKQMFPITPFQLPCLIGCLEKLPENTPYRQLIHIPPYHQGERSTISREHLVIESFKSGVAKIKILGKNGCFIDYVTQPETFYLNMNQQVQLGIDTPPVTITLTENQINTI